MALRKRQMERSAGVAPAEFYDVSDPAWATPEDTREWFGVRRLPDPSPVIASLFESCGPFTHRRHAIEAWLIENGYASEQWPKLPDWHRVAELELPRGWQADSTRERIAQVGVD